MFSIRGVLQEAQRRGAASWDAATEYLGAGVTYVRESLAGSWLFGSTERLDAADGELAYDEKHYFLVPFRLASAGYSLYSMRCLPEGTPPVNDLPKRRLVHVPTEAGVAIVESLLLAESRREVVDSAAQRDNAGLAGRLKELADRIDTLDSQVFHGVLAIGGLVAFVNPVAGAGIAAKALLPSAAMLLSKFGLRSASEALEQRRVQRDVREAERAVLKQFHGAETTRVVSPMLAALDRALETNEHQFDPLLDFDAELDGIEPDAAGRRQRARLTCRAIVNVYSDVLNSPAEHGHAQLGPEDLRWLRMLQEMLAE